MTHGPAPSHFQRSGVMVCNHVQRPSGINGCGDTLGEFRNVHRSQPFGDHSVR